MDYCTATKLAEFVLQGYLDKAEEKNPGILAQSIETVSGEIDDLLRPIYVLPLSAVPPTLEKIAAVLASYRAVGSITSVLNEAEFLYIRDEAKKAEKTLREIAAGSLDIGLTELGAEPAGESGLQVKSPPVIFDDETMGKY